MSKEEQIILPDRFKRVEYLESTGTQWIDTGVIPNNETGAYVKALQTVIGNTFPMGAGSNNSGWVPMRLLMKGNGSYPTYRWGTYWSDSSSSFNDNIIYTSEFNWLNDKSVNLFKGEELIISKTLNSSTNINPGCTAAIFAVNNNTGNINYQWKGRVYEVKISQGENIVRHFIPCLDANGNPCMYELVSQKPFYNQGSGIFLTNKGYGWNYPFINNDYNLPAGFKKCVYLQSDGTQYIDLDVYPNNETGLLIKAMAMGEANGCPMGSNHTAPYVYPPRKTLSSNRQIAYAWNNWYNSSVLLNWDKAGDLEYTSFVNYFNSRMVYFNSEDSDIVSAINSDVLPQLKTNVRLFNWSGEFTSPWIGRIYRAQITQGDALIHDYVPCLDANGRPCMYDIIGGGNVEDNTYYNQSSGTEFTYCVEHQLPSDFIKLKYLESTGTQYIKTGHIPTNTTGLYIDTQDVGSGDTIPMGSWNSTSTATRFFITRQTASKSAGYGWGAWTEISTTRGSFRYESTLNWLNDRKSITNSPLFSTILKNLGELPFTPQYDIWMFGVNHAESHAYKFKGRIHRAKISEGTEIVRDFVPAYDELKLKPCMYDLINNVAYYNDGEGEFLYNNDVEGTYKGFTGLGCIGNRLSGNAYTLVNALITDGRCRINLGKGIIDATISHDFRGYTTDKNRFMFGTSTSGPDYFWQGHGIVALGGRQYSGFTDNSDLIVIVDIENSKIRCNKAIYGISSITNFTSDKQTSIFDVGRKDTETSYMPATNGSKFYKWVMKKDGVIIHDYRPAVDKNSIPCVLDTITGEAFYNTLSGVLSWE